MPLAVNDVVRVSTRFALSDGSDHVNVYHWQVNAYVDMTDSQFLTAMANHMDASYAYFDGWLDLGMIGVDLKADVVEWLGGKWVITRNLGTTSLPNTNFSPSGTGDNLPHTDAAVVNLMTGYGKSMGRKFYGGLVESAQNDGSLVSSAATALTSMLTALFAQVTISAGNTVVPVIVSTVDGVVRLIIEEVISSYLGRQGRRRQDVGT